MQQIRGLGHAALALKGPELMGLSSKISRELWDDLACPAISDEGR